MHTAEEVWTAAVAAQRINGQYVRVNQYAEKIVAPDGSTVILESNRSVMQKILKGLLPVTDEDRETGKLCRDHFRNICFKMLTKGVLNDFENTAYRISEKEVFEDHKEFAFIACLPNSYAKDKILLDANQKFAFSSGYIGQLKEKVTVTGVMLDSYMNFYSIYCRFWTEDQKAVRFTSKTFYEHGKKLTVSGKVFKQYDNITQLTRITVHEHD
jgi:hypothetical protein